jgi:cytochrome d ubiquinol oxidase subunit II
MLGVIAAATLLGAFGPMEESFYGAYIRPWANLFCLSVGVFTGVLFTFLAAVYLIGETTDPELKWLFMRRALLLNALAVLVGALVFVAAELSGLALVRLFAGKAISLASMIGATLILVPLWIAIRRNRLQIARVLVATQVALVLIGWFRLHYPAIINSPIEPLTIYTAAAPEATLRYLLYALIGGSLLIFPALIYLLAIFKLSEADEPARNSSRQ